MKRSLLAVAVLLTAGLAACASDFTSRPNRPTMEAPTYTGEFTGEFVDGLPLYRFPTIVVVGSRSSLGLAPGAD